jgi:hypothetical protein
MNKIFLFFLLLGVNSFAQDTDFNWKDKGLHDKVRKITEDDYKYEDNQKKLETTWVYFYDKMGLGVKSITIHHEEEKLKTSYSAYGHYIDLYGTYKDSSIYFYNDKNQLIETQEYNPTGVILKDYYTRTNIYTIDKTEECYKGDCKIINIGINASTNFTHLSLDNEGAIQEFSYMNQTDKDSVFEQIYSSNSESQFIIRDKKKKIGITKNYLGADTSNLNEYCINYYDDSLKNVVRQKIYGSDKKTLLKENYYTYKNGNLIEDKALNENGKVIRTIKYNTNETITIELNDSGKFDTSISRTVQIFDKYGNWVNEKYYFSGEIDSENDREIEYFKENDEEGYKYIYADNMSSSSYSWQPNDSIDKSLNIKPNRLQLLVKFDDYSKVYIYLINKSDSAVNYSSQDGKIPMIREAINDKGEWQPIEYWEWSWCGNSYHSGAISPGKNYCMNTFVYGGAIRTKIRFKMLLGNYILYSDSYNGRVNKGQFIKPKNMYEKGFLDLKK